jgi:hypothetical protein
MVQLDMVMAFFNPAYQETASFPNKANFFTLAWITDAWCFNRQIIILYGLQGIHLNTNNIQRGCILTDQLMEAT